MRFEKQGYGTMYVFQDANWNVTSTANLNGVVLDPSPYGQPLFETQPINCDYDGDGDCDSSDATSFAACKSGSQPVTGACRVCDFNNDRNVDATDEAFFNTYYPGSKEIYRIAARERRSPQYCHVQASRTTAADITVRIQPWQLSGFGAGGVTNMIGGNSVKLRSIYAGAHELGHVMGAPHCPAEPGHIGHIMHYHSAFNAGPTPCHSVKTVVYQNGPSAGILVPCP